MINLIEREREERILTEAAVPLFYIWFLVHYSHSNYFGFLFVVCTVASKAANEYVQLILSLYGKRYLTMLIVF